MAKTRLTAAFNRYTTIALSAAMIVAVSGAVNAADKKDGELTLDPQGAQTAKLGYFPVQIKLSADKPAGIKKEPAYRTTPRYAEIHVGNGPKSSYIIAVDEPKDADFKIYVDLNRNGDLTDDGDGAWSKKNEANGRVMYGVNDYTFRASWGTAKRETSTGKYGIGFYRFPNLDSLLCYREAARTGKVKVDGKELNVVLVENDADAVFNKALDDSGKPVAGGAASRPVWLVVDGRPVDVRSPFKLEGKAYEAVVADNGERIEIKPTKREVKTPEPPKQKALLANGVAAPDFTVLTPENAETKLSQFKGKIVILDFWATWCGPCQKSMPHLNKVYTAAKDKNVVVLAVCVSDTREAFDKWVTANKTTYSFPVFFDPAGRDGAKSISNSLYNVSGIPTTYVIDANGKVAASLVGFAGDTDDRLEKALSPLGVNIEK